MKKKLLIKGMSCAHCIAHVTEALKEVCGVSSVTVNLDEQNAVVSLKHEVDDAELIKAVKEAGYDVKKVTEVI